MEQIQVALSTVGIPHLLGGLASALPLWWLSRQEELGGGKSSSASSTSHHQLYTIGKADLHYPSDPEVELTLPIQFYPPQWEHPDTHLLPSPVQIRVGAKTSHLRLETRERGIFRSVGSNGAVEYPLFAFLLSPGATNQTVTIQHDLPAIVLHATRNHQEAPAPEWMMVQVPTGRDTVFSYVLNWESGQAEWRPMFSA